MPTVPTGEMERELRKLYFRWVAGLSRHENDLGNYIAKFRRESLALVKRYGGRAASLGALAGFAAPKELDLDPVAAVAYDQMQKAAVAGSISAGLGATDAAQAMIRAGMDKSYRRLRMIARTETVRAYWKNAWDSIADLPALVMLWGSEDGPRTCEWCKERDGLVMDSPDLRDHPNGRCTPVPTLRSQVNYRGSVSRDGSIYYDSDWEATQDERLFNQPVTPREVVA